MPMQITDAADNRELNHVGLGLTEAEARELRDTLTTLLEDSGERHEHVSSSDYKRELTVWLRRVDEPSGHQSPTLAKPSALAEAPADA